VVKDKKQWLEKDRNIDQMNLQIEVLTTQFQTLLASQIVGIEVGANSKGILATPNIRKDAVINTSREEIVSRFRSQNHGDSLIGQE